MKLLQKLWAINQREREKTGKASNEVFYGLYLYDLNMLSNENYHSTPINSTTFARTGGDGVHFGLLHIDGKVADSSPIVMTVPMMFDNPNVILGENLFEFLCLSCDVGFFVLEQIAYHFWGKSDTDWVSDCQSEMDDEQRELLKLLKDELDLKSWTNVEARLNELQQQYQPLLQFREDT